MLLGCGSREAAPPVVRPFACPAPPASGEPNLHAAGTRLYLSWLTGGEGHHALQYAVLEDGRWSDIHDVAAGDSFFVNWADFPSLVELADGALLAHWLWKSSVEGPYAYDVVVARASDGVHWGSPARPHRDATPTEHGFVSLIPEAAGGATVVWLDGRKYAEPSSGGEEHADGAHADGGETQLYCATLTAAGFSPERVLDPRVCDCCPTSAVRTASGILVAYRDRSPTEVRDIFLVRFESGAWTEPYPLAEDGWQISGCPVNGPALAASDRRVAAAWFTMGGSEPAVRLAFSQDEGKTFPVNVRADDGNPLGRVDILLVRNGALVVWLESPPKGAAEIRARRVLDDGTLEPSFLVAATSPERASGFPKLEGLGERILFAWTESGEPSQVHMAAIETPKSWR